MNINNKGELEIPICNLLRAISRESKAELINYLSCDTQVIKNVVNQIIDGFFDDQDGLWWSGAIDNTLQSVPSEGLSWAQREIALRANEVAQKEIEGLQSALEKLQKEYWAEVNNKPKIDPNRSVLDW